MTIHCYLLKAPSECALISMLQAAQAGKEMPFVYEAEGGVHVDASRVVIPRPETEDGEPVDDGEGGVCIPQVPTGMWFCEVRLTEPDADLAALSFVIT